MGVRGYEPTADGSDFDQNWTEDVAKAQGRIDNVGLYPEVAASYIIFKVGSTYYRRDGSSGIVDDSNADAATLIQPTIVAVEAAGGGLIKYKAADYEITNTVNVTDNGVMFSGEGNASRWVAANGANITMLELGDVVNHPSGFNIEHMAFKETGNGQTCIGISDIYANHPIIFDVELEGLQRGFYTESPISNVTMTHCYPTYCDYGIDIANGHDSLYRDIMVDNCDIYGLHITEGYELHIIGSSFEDTATGEGIYVEYAGGANVNYCSVMGCFFTSIVRGVNIEGGYGWKVVGNQFRLTNNESIYMQSTNSRYSTIANNTVESAGDYGIRVEGQWLTLTGNAVKGSTTYNIYTVSGGQYITVTGNSSQGAVDGIRLESGFTSMNNNSVSHASANGLYSSGPDNVINGNFVRACVDGLELNGGGDRNMVTGNVLINNSAYGIMIDNGADLNQIQNNRTIGNATACVRVNNANCDKNLFSNNCFDEGNISDAGTNTIAWLNWDPSAGAFIATINAPAVVGGGGGALP